MASESTHKVEMMTLNKIILKSFLSPGDIIMLTAAVRDLHLTYPGEFITDIRTSCDALWENNPYINPLDESDPDVQVIDCDYPLIHQSNQLPYHFIHGYRLFLNETLGIDIKPHRFAGDIHITDEEKGWISQIDEITGMPDTRFWIIVSGGKNDYTAKWWEPHRFQEIVNHFRDRILFVQCGEINDEHVHPHLNGVIDLVGSTDLRQLVRLMYHADGVICPVTMFMHLATAVETKQRRPANRPCVVIAGGREPSHWEAYPHHQYLHRAGCLPCCDNGGCWKSRTIPLDDGSHHNDSLCEFPVKTASGFYLPKCLDMVTTADVITAVENYLRYDAYTWRHFYK